MNCSICKVVGDGIRDRVVLDENAAAVAWLHESRAHRGHSVIAARRHVENLSDLDDREAQGFLALARRVERAALDETASHRAILMKLGLLVPHLHLHVYPVTRDASREEVMQIIDGAVTDDATPAQKADFAASLRARLSEGTGL
jgi:histidine triad (HIT) family protein